MAAWGTSRREEHVRSQPRASLSEVVPLSGWAWGAVGLSVVFVAISCWWLSHDLGIPSADAGSHLFTAIAYHDVLADGDLGMFWTRSAWYPPLTFVVGALATFVGGVNQWAPVVGQNVVYVPALAAGCYGTARLLAGPPAGFLAVAFALGSPLVIEQFHVFMIDVPEAALVALAVWLILASDRFARVGVAALAGLAVGLGISSKEQFPLFVTGLLLAVLVRGGWRNWRGLAAAAGVALAVALPWYAINWEHLGTYAGAGLGNANLPARGKPPLLSVANLGWYLWACLNGLLFAPLFAFAVVGVGHAVAVVARASSGARTAAVGCRPELLSGLVVGWLGITLTPHHDMRYTLPLIVYLAVLSVAWIPSLARMPRRMATAVLLAAVVATTLGASFGVGPQVRILLAGHPVRTDVSFGIPPPDQITLYSDRDFVVSAPRREADAPGFFAALHRDGVRGLTWAGPDFRTGDTAADPQGIELLARFAGLQRLDLLPTWDGHDPHNAFLIHRPELVLGVPASALPPPCLRLADGSGLWVLVGQLPGDPGLHVSCPQGWPRPPS